MRVRLLAVYCGGFVSSYFSSNLLQNKGKPLVVDGPGLEIGSPSMKVFD